MRRIRLTNAIHSKSNATSHAVAERQGLDKLSRDLKTGARSSASLQTKHDEYDAKQTTLMQDYETWKEKAAEVRSLRIRSVLAHVSQAEEKVTKFKADVKAVKQHLDKNEAERTKIS